MAGAFLGAWVGSARDRQLAPLCGPFTRSWCYWGAIPFAIRCGKVRSGANLKLTETRTNTGDFAVLGFDAYCCGML